MLRRRIVRAAVVLSLPVGLLFEGLTVVVSSFQDPSWQGTAAALWIFVLYFVVVRGMWVDEALGMQNSPGQTST